MIQRDTYRILGANSLLNASRYTRSLVSGCQPLDWLYSLGGCRLTAQWDKADASLSAGRNHECTRLTLVGRSFTAFPFLAWMHDNDHRSVFFTPVVTGFRTNTRGFSPLRCHMFPFMRRFRNNDYDSGRHCPTEVNG